MTRTQQARLNNLLPNGKPKYVRIYDNEGESLDNFTIVYTGRYPKDHGAFIYVVMNGNPRHPQHGICQHGESYGALDTLHPGRLGWAPRVGKRHPWHGKRITFDDLPSDCQEIVLEEYKGLWNLGTTAELSARLGRVTTEVDKICRESSPPNKEGWVVLGGLKRPSETNNT